MTVQELVVGEQTFGNAFGVVKAVDRQHDLATRAAGHDVLDALARGGGAGTLRVAPIVDSHGEGIDGHQPLVDDHAAVLLLDAQDATYAGEESCSVVVRVKANEVAAQKALENLLAPRQDAEHLEARKRDV